MNIPFNKPFLTGKEIYYINDAVGTDHISGNGKYTKMCQHYFEERWGFKKTLLTTSCTDALEMCSMLLNIQSGDEIIMPSYTFVSTALAFVRQGAKIVFTDSRDNHPCMDVSKIESLITPRTKAIVPVHYAGVACDMEKIMDISSRHNLYVVEDAAQAIGSYYIGKDGVRNPLGSIGHLGCFSFHETKNIQCGEGGLLAINDEKFVKRAEILWEKGTNRAEFFRGEVNKYNWVDTGSSFLPSEISAAFLWAQIENLEKVQQRRKRLWDRYFQELEPIAHKGFFSLPTIPEYAKNNAHLFYLICNSFEERNSLIEHLNQHGIMALFHYLSLHSSPYYTDKHDGRSLPNCDRFADCLLRLPLYYDLKVENLLRTTTNIQTKFK